MALIDRTLLARELHDGIAQDLVAVGYALDNIIGSPTTSPESRINIRKIRFEIAELVEKVRSEIHELIGESRGNFPESIQKIIENFSSNISFHFHKMDSSLSLEDELSYQVLKIFTELIRNIVTHANSTIISVELSHVGNQIEIKILDNGFGDIARKSG